MSCAEFEERIARFVGGDLGTEERAAVEQHLRVCAECAELARGLEDDRAWLASRPPETAEVDFVAMRREIRRRIGCQRRGWKWLAAAAAILLAVGVGTTVRRAPVDPGAPTKVVTAAATAPDRSLARQSASTVAARKERVRKTRPRPKPPLSEPESPVEIRIATNDPNVTIILLHEYKGEPQ